jgi:intracellular multiplication protein IcmO
MNAIRNRCGDDPGSRLEGAGAVSEIIAAVRNELSRDVATEAGSRSDWFFMVRAEGLMRSLLPALDWLGTHKDYPLTIDTIRNAFELPWLRALATRQLVLLQDRGSGAFRKFCDADDMPLELLMVVRGYVGMVPDGDEAERQHQFVTMFFCAGFTRLRRDIAHWVH